VKRLGFQPRALSFLRALKRNNDREWFRARKDEYDRLLRVPMITMIERLAALQPTTLACMHGAAWRGDGGALLRALGTRLQA